MAANAFASVCLQQRSRVRGVSISMPYVTSDPQKATLNTSAPSSEASGSPVEKFAAITRQGLAECPLFLWQNCIKAHVTAAMRSESGLDNMLSLDSRLQLLLRGKPARPSGVAEEVGQEERKEHRFSSRTI